MMEQQRKCKEEWMKNAKEGVKEDDDDDDENECVRGEESELSE